MNTDLLAQVEHLKHLHATLLTASHVAQSRATALTAEIATLQSEEDILTLSNKGFEVLLASVAAESTVAVEQLLTYGLMTSFPDLGLSCRLDISTKRGAQWVEVRLVQQTPNGPVDAPILDAYGGGPASVVSFLLRLLVCRRMQLAPVLLLDEAFSFASVEYVPGVAALLRELAERLNLTIVLVTHQPAFLDYAHVAYRISTEHGAAVFTPVNA